MAFQILILFACYTIIAVSGQQTPSDDCLTKCTDVFYGYRVRVDPVSMLNVQSIKLSDGKTIECPQINDTVRLEKSCGPYRIARQCIDLCPPSDAKSTLLDTYGSLQFMCIDRTDDLKGYMPCLSEHCAEIQWPCIPKCGSFHHIIKSVLALLSESYEHSYEQPGNSTQLDFAKFTKVIGESCSRLYCINECDRESTRNFCGNGAVALGEDLQWTTFSSMFYSLRQFGVNIDWPVECKNLAAQWRKRL